MLEFVLAFTQELKCGAGLFFILSAIVVFGVFIAACALCDDLSCNPIPFRKTLSTFHFGKFVCLMLLSGFIGSIPTMDDMFKVRIALIKYELASPENVKGATETIERIGAKLECKYLGCKHEDKKE